MDVTTINSITLAFIMRRMKYPNAVERVKQAKDTRGSSDDSTKNIKTHSYRLFFNRVDIKSLLANYSLFSKKSTGNYRLKL